MRHWPRCSGSMLNATTKEVVANILLVTTDGLETEAGFWGSGIMPLVWSADGHSAWMSFTGYA